MSVYVSAGCSSDDFFGNTLVELAQPFELLQDISCHSLADPVHGLTECQTCVIVDKERFVLRVYSYTFAESVEVFRYDVLAYPHEVGIEYISVIGVIEVHNGFFMVESELQSGNYGALDAVKCVMCTDKSLGLFQDDVLDE